MTAPTKPVLLTGASGALGRHLAKALSERGWRLRLTDIAPFPDPLPATASVSSGRRVGRMTRRVMLPAAFFGLPVFPRPKMPRVNAEE